MIPILVGHLQSLLTERINEGVYNCLILCYIMFFTSNKFDLAFIKMLRYFVFNFCKFTPDFTFNDLSIRTTIEEVEGMPLETFCEQEILMLGVDARSVILLILPLILRINIKTVLLDLQAKQPDTRDNFTETYYSTSPDMTYRLEDSLNFHNKDIYICLKPGHYDALYSYEFTEFIYPNIVNYCTAAYEYICELEKKKRNVGIEYLITKDSTGQVPMVSIYLPGGGGGDTGIVPAPPSSSSDTDRNPSMIPRAKDTSPQPIINDYENGQLMHPDDIEEIKKQQELIEMYEKINQKEKQKKDLDTKEEKTIIQPVPLITDEENISMEHSFVEEDQLIDEDIDEKTSKIGFIDKNSIPLGKYDQVVLPPTPFYTLFAFLDNMLLKCLIRKNKKQGN